MGSFQKRELYWEHPSAPLPVPGNTRDPHLNSFLSHEELQATAILYASQEHSSGGDGAHWPSPGSIQAWSDPCQVP